MSAIFPAVATFPDVLRFSYSCLRNDPGLQESAFGYWEQGNWAQPYADARQDVDVLWPRTNMFGSPANICAPSPNLFDCMSQRWVFDWPATGQQRPFYVTGQTVDANGVPKGSVTVNLYSSTDSTLQSTGISDANGNYSLPNQLQAGSFVTGQLVGSPDTQGITDDVTGT